MIKRGLITLFIVLCLGGSGALVVEKYDAYQTSLSNSSEVLINELVLPIVRMTFNQRPLKTLGSGVIIYSKARTFVLTCHHLTSVGPPTKIEVFNKDATITEVTGEVLFQDEATDLALMELDVQNLPCAKLLPPEMVPLLKVFNKVRAVGCPLGFNPYPTFGEITIIDATQFCISAQIVPGNSGGGCYLDKGHYLIGLPHKVQAQAAAWHIAKIIPVSVIYPWLDRIGYSFLYKGE